MSRHMKLRKSLIKINMKDKVIIVLFLIFICSKLIFNYINRNIVNVLETIAKYDNPKLHGKSGLREYQAQKSKYCSTRTVKEEFDDLIKNANFQYIFLSYNNEGPMPFDAIKEIMEKYGEYNVFSTDYKRFRADKEENRNHKANKTTEYLHCLVKR